MKSICGIGLSLVVVALPLCASARSLDGRVEREREQRLSRQCGPVIAQALGTGYKVFRACPTQVTPCWPRFPSTHPMVQKARQYAGAGSAKIAYFCRLSHQRFCARPKLTKKELAHCLVSYL